jgi:Fic family protein
MLKIDTLRITLEVLGLIARIDEFKGVWRTLGRLARYRLSALRRVATIESIGSSTGIEGSKLSDREVERRLSNLAIKKFETRDEQEVASYAELMDLMLRACTTRNSGPPCVQRAGDGRCCKTCRSLLRTHVAPYDHKD